MENSFEVSFLRTLVELKLITAEDAVKLLAAYHESDVDQFDEFLLSEGILDTENLLQALSEYYQVPSFDVQGYFFERHLLHMFPQDMMVRNEIIPLQVDESMMVVVAAKPDNPDLLFEIGEYVSYDIRFYVGIAQDIIDAVREYWDKADTEVKEDDDIREEQLLRSEFMHIEDEDGEIVYPTNTDDMVKDEEIVEDEEGEVAYFEEL
jgi:Type II secretion system (T2SS), protein E, N-terminal domain